jgi:hypothetical protein
VYLLGLSVLLGIALRRVLALQNPLKDEVYMKNVAIEYVQSGVAWVRALADTLGSMPKDLVKREWYDLFAVQDQAQLKEAFSKMLLLGKATLQVHGRRKDGTYAGLELLMVAIHDHRMRFVGHHCLVVDRTRERVLEAKVAELTKAAQQQSSAVR